MNIRQIILDTETTGLDPKEGHKIIEIGCLELLNRQITGSTYHCYINPQRLVEAAAQAVHGITDEFLQDKPVFSSISEEFIAYVKDAELIIHNAPFDLAFLDHELKACGKKFKMTDICTVIDTLAVARRKHPGQQNSLDALCRRYHVDNTARNLHGALVDANLLAQVYLFMSGGQGQLFDASTEKVVTEIQTHVMIEKERAPLPVILPTETEWALHAKFMQEKLSFKDR